MTLLDVLSLFEEHPIEFISLIISVFAALFAWKSMVISKRALKVAVNEYQSKQPNFDMYLIDSYREMIKIEESPTSFIVINLTIFNKSQTDSSYHATLKLTYIDESDKSGTIEIIHDPTLLQNISSDQIEVFPTDINVQGKNSESKWLIFREPGYLIAKYRIKKYSIEVSDINQIICSNEIFIIKDIIHENRKKRQTDS